MAPDVLDANERPERAVNRKNAQNRSYKPLFLLLLSDPFQPVHIHP